MLNKEKTEGFKDLETAVTRFEEMKKEDADSTKSMYPYGLAQYLQESVFCSKGDLFDFIEFCCVKNRIIKINNQ